MTSPPPAGSTVDFDVIPDPGVEVSAYAFRLGRDSYTMPPFVPSVVQCEASYNFALGTPPNPGAVESVATVHGIGSDLMRGHARIVGVLLGKC